MHACSKIPTLMPMGRPSGSLFNHTPSSQWGICDWTRFRPAVASSCEATIRGVSNLSVPISCPSDYGLLDWPRSHCVIFAVQLAESGKMPHCILANQIIRKKI